MEWWDHLDYELDWRISGERDPANDPQHTTQDSHNTIQRNEATSSTNDSLAVAMGGPLQEQRKDSETLLENPSDSTTYHHDLDTTNKQAADQRGSNDTTNTIQTLSTDHEHFSTTSGVVSDRIEHGSFEQETPKKSFWGIATDRSEETTSKACLPVDNNNSVNVFKSEGGSTSVALTVSRKPLEGSSIASPAIHGDCRRDQLTGSVTYPASSKLINGMAHELNNREDDSASQTQQLPFKPLDSLSLRVGESSSGVSSHIDMGSPELGRSTSSLGSRHDFSDFEVPMPFQDWNDPGDPHVKPFDKLSMNCHGIFHVRVLRASRLPCPVGSSVHATMSLPPWSGRVRTDHVPAFSSTLDHGVCARWDQQLSDTAGLCSMINAWSSDESAVPSIKIELMFSPLGMGLFEVCMCTLDLGCEVLMQSPEIWKTQWCYTTVSARSAKDSKSDDKVPLMQVEAMFAPSLKRKDSSTALALSDEKSFTNDKRGFRNDESALAQRFLDQTPSRLARDSTSEDVGETSTVKSAGVEGVTVASSVPVALNAENRPHHLRILSLWKPASCHVCSKIIIGRKGFHCEQCGIYCCGDCRINVDILLPCGSESAKAAVEQSIQSKLTVGNLLSIVAPLDADASKKLPAGESGRKEHQEDSTILGTSPRRLFDDSEEPEGIGCLKLEFVRACLFNNSIPADSDVGRIENGSNLLRGDYYARLTCNETSKTARTGTLQSVGMPVFDADEMRFEVSHYGTEFRIEVVDASTDASIGTALLTTHGLLQDQRDVVVSEGGVPLLECLNGPLCFKSMRAVTLELRKGVKSGSSSDFFVPSKASIGGGGGKAQPGEISGWVEIRVCLEEYVDRLYAQENPLKCPPRPPDELNMGNFQIHLARIKLLIEDITVVFQQYQYLVSWKDPVLTGASLVIFLWFCFSFNAEYSGSLPILALMTRMVYLAVNRSKGDPKKRFVHREVEACRKAGNVSLTYTLHRPVGTVDVAVRKGKDLMSLEFGLPGSSGCQVFWDPVRFADEKTKKSLTKVDSSAKSKHEIGSTEAVYAANPEWSTHTDSAELKRLKQLLPSSGDFFETSLGSEKESNLSFPLLQPFEVTESSGNGQNSLLDASLKPWSTSPGAVVVEVRFLDILNNLPGFNDTLGEVAIPFSRLIERREISGWFQVLEAGTTRVIEVESDMKNDIAPTIRDHPDRAVPVQQIFLSLKWHPPSSTKDPSPDEREASFAIQEELVRSSILTQRQKVDLVESSIDAINTALGLGGNVQVVQNSLGSILDSIEGIRNSFNFTDPFKSSVLFVFFVVLWLFLVMIPTRYIVLCAGLAQYCITFMRRFEPFFGNGKEDTKRARHVSSSGGIAEANEKEAFSNPISTWIMNAVQGLPTQEDLRKTYFWESRRRGYIESNKYATEKRRSRLRQLWKAQWHSVIKLRTNSDGSIAQWENAFAIIQGHRFLWWRSVHDFDNGELPLGRIFLSGHAGLTGPSPLEMRELLPEELPLTVTIFGRGISGQERVMLLAPDVATKDRIENDILSASTKKAD